MQQYPNYYPAQMPTYPNNYQQLNNNPYMDRLNQLQQFQQNLQPTQMSATNQFVPLGKMVESEDIVKATDIPMDGNVYYFPKADGSMIFSKQWLPNGTTRLIAFKPILDDDVNNLPQADLKGEFTLSDEVTGLFMEQFQNIVSRIDKLEKNLKSTKTKKEAQDD